MGSLPRSVLVLVPALALAATGMLRPTAAAADTAATVATAAAAVEVSAAKPAASPPRRHAIFLEAMGRGGLWGAGYGLQLRRRLGVGAVASFSELDGQHLMSFSPYLTAYPVGGRRHRWFVDVGPQLVHLSTPSPVPEWDGTSSTGVGGQLATGYELRARVLVRAFVMVAVGGGGAAPWFGADVGWTL